MFFTIISKLPALVSDDNKKLLKIFIIGTVLYLLCHYYLFSGERSTILNNVKKYFYHVMAVDFVVAYLVITLLSPKKDDDETKDNTDVKDSEDEHDKKYSKEERDEIDRTMKAQSLRQQLYLTQQVMAKQASEIQTKKSDKETHSEKSTKLSTPKNDDNSSDKKIEKPKKNKKSKTKPKTKTDTKTETDVPTFNANEEEE
jgi:hypothetical protein